METILNEAIAWITATLTNSVWVLMIINWIKDKWSPPTAWIPWLAAGTGAIVGTTGAILRIANKPPDLATWLWYLIYIVAGIISSKVASALWETAKNAAWHVEGKITDELTQDACKEEKP